MKKLKYLLIFAAVCVLSSCAKEVQPERAGSNAGAAINGGEVEKGWIRIKLSESAEPLQVGVFTRGAALSGNAEMDRIAQELGATEVIRVFNDGGKFAERRRRYGLHLWYDVRFDEEIPVSRAASKFGALKGVQCVEPIYKIFNLSDGVAMPAEAIFTPAVSVSRPKDMPFNDPQLSDQWHYNNVGGSTSFSEGADINVFEAWKVEVGKPNVIVSIHDEGMDVNHADLAAHMWVNTAEKNGQEGVDDDGNGYVDDVNGWSFVNGSGSIENHTHGTHVAGTISAVNNNGVGVCGVAGGTGPNDGVRIMSTQVINVEHNIILRAADSYAYAADNGSVISQNSWTLGTVGDLPSSYADAFDYYIDNAGTDEKGNQTGPMKGGIIIFAAGNSGTATLLPAASDRVIAVAAMTPNYSKASYTNYGPEVDIFAPGGSNTGAGQVLSLDKDNGYQYLWGTSMACPHVSGVAGLIVSHFGGQGFTAADCKQRLLNAYRPMGGRVSDKDLTNIGVGLVDAAIALMDDPKVKPAAVESAAATASLNSVKLSWKVPADGNKLPVAKYIVEYEGVAPSAAFEASSKTFVNYYEVGETVSFDMSVDYNKNYTLKVYAQDRYGNKSDAVNLSVTTPNFDNKAPVQKKQIPDVRIEQAGADYAVSYTLSDYIGDSNISQGDVLTYTAHSSVSTIVSADIEGGKTLKITPKAQGQATITVTATDLAGESVKISFKANVLSGGNPVVDSGELSIYPNPVGGELNFGLTKVSSANVEAAVYDAASRKIVETTVTVNAEGKGTVDVSKLSAGVYTLAVKVSGSKLKCSFVKK